MSLLGWGAFVQAARFQDAGVRDIVLRDEAELLIGSELGARHIHAMLINCWL